MKTDRPVGVTIISVSGFIFASFILCWNLVQTETLRVHIFYFAILVPTVLVHYGLFKLKKWALYTTLFFAACWGLWGLICVAIALLMLLVGLIGGFGLCRGLQQGHPHPQLSALNNNQPKLSQSNSRWLPFLPILSTEVT